METKTTRTRTTEWPRYSEALGHVHSSLNDEYWQALFRAEYFRWAATRGFVGRDPLDGRQSTTPTHRKAERAANVAQARVWLAHAAALRTASRRDVLGNV